MFIALLSYARHLASKYMALDNETWMTGPALIDVNPIELNSFMVRTKMITVEILTDMLSIIANI